MVEICLPLRNGLKNEIKAYCTTNNISCNIDYSECVFVVGTPKQVTQVENFIDMIEQDRYNYRSRKSFWWRLFN
jgi:hypothetical protein